MMNAIDNAIKFSDSVLAGAEIITIDFDTLSFSEYEAARIYLSALHHCQDISEIMISMYSFSMILRYKNLKDTVVDIFAKPSLTRIVITGGFASWNPAVIEFLRDNMSHSITELRLSGKIANSGLGSKIFLTLLQQHPQIQKLFFIGADHPPFRFSHQKVLMQHPSLTHLVISADVESMLSQAKLLAFSNIIQHNKTLNSITLTVYFNFGLEFNLSYFLKLLNTVRENRTLEMFELNFQRYIHYSNTLSITAWMRIMPALYAILRDNPTLFHFKLRGFDDICPDPETLESYSTPRNFSLRDFAVNTKVILQQHFRNPFPVVKNAIRELYKTLKYWKELPEAFNHYFGIPHLISRKKTIISQQKCGELNYDIENRTMRFLLNYHARHKHATQILDDRNLRTEITQFLPNDAKSMLFFSIFTAEVNQPAQQSVEQHQPDESINEPMTKKRRIY